MPPKDRSFWSDRAKRKTSTWYENPALDWEARALWKHAVKRLRLEIADKYLLDIGCGDGQLSRWMADQFGCNVIAADYFKYGRESHPKVVYVKSNVDIENTGAFLKAFSKVHVVMVSGVFECTSDWRKAFWNCSKIADRMIVIEDLREKVPEYQQNLPYKTAITWGQFAVHVERCGFRITRWVPVTVLDRALLVHCPDWLIWPCAWLSYAIDMVLTSGEPARYWGTWTLSRSWHWAKIRACYLERVEEKHESAVS